MSQATVSNDSESIKPSFPSFTMPMEMWPAINELTLEQRGQLLTACFNYHQSVRKAPMIDDKFVRAMFLALRPGFDRARAEYQTGANT